MKVKVYHTQNATFYQNVDISSLSKGLYIIKATSEKGEILYQKFFVY